MWQNQHTCVEKRKHYVALCKLVRQAVKKDKEKWWDTNMAAMEADLRRCRQGDREVDRQEAHPFVGVILLTGT